MNKFILLHKDGSNPIILRKGVIKSVSKSSGNTLVEIFDSLEGIKVTETVEEVYKLLDEAPPVTA